MPNMIPENWDDIRNMVTDIAAKNMIDVEAQFSNIMKTKVLDALDAKRQEVAKSIYGGKPQTSSEDEHSAENGSETE